MPRLPRGKSAKWKVTLPLDLAGRVELALMNKQTGRPVYGLRSQLVRELLQDWVASGDQPLKDPQEAEHEET